MSQTQQAQHKGSCGPFGLWLVGPMQWEVRKGDEVVGFASNENGCRNVARRLYSAHQANLEASAAKLAEVTRERDRLTAAMKSVAAERCKYCRDGREPFQQGQTWWHEVARGGDLGSTEPCCAHVVHEVAAIATRMSPAVNQEEAATDNGVAVGS